jgi:hypothetical protein
MGGSLLSKGGPSWTRPKEKHTNRADCSKHGYLVHLVVGVDLEAKRCDLWLESHLEKLNKYGPLVKSEGVCVCVCVCV